MRRVLSVGLILVVSGCATETVLPQHEKPSPPLTAEQFRAGFPLDDAQADAVLEDYNRVQAKLMEKSANGARETVSLLTADGHVHSGYDDFFSSGEKKVREVRENSVGIQIGTTSCVRTPDKTKCMQGNPLHLGLVDISKSHVARVWSKDLSCFQEPVPCRFIKIEVGSAESVTNSSEGYSADPELVGHDYELLFTLSDYVPIFYKQTDHYRVAVTATAFYSYQFDQSVERIELPSENEVIN